MSEQTSARELWASLIDLYCKIEEAQPGGHNIRKLLSLGDEACIERILADRKATVEKCIAVLRGMRGIWDGEWYSISQEMVWHSLDVVLEEME